MSLKGAVSAWRSTELPNLFSLLIFFSATALIFRSWEFALIVTASLGFHELGHVTALMFHRLEWRMHFGLVGAWTWSLTEQRARLSQWANASIHLAGPFFSLVLALLALILNALWQPESRHLLVLANFSAQVGFLNLLPFGPITDGGKIIRRVIRSFGQGYRRLAWLPPALTLLLLALYTLVQLPYMNEEGLLLLGMLLVAIWMTGSLWLEAVQVARQARKQPGPSTGVRAPQAGLIPVTGSTDEPAWDHASEPMNVRQIALLMLLVWDLLMLYLLVISVTPFWLEPQYVRGTLENVMLLFDGLMTILP